MKTKKTHVFFWFFDPKTKNTMQNQKNQKSSRNQKILSQILVFWFRVVLLSRKIVGSRLPKQMAAYVGVVIEKKRFLC